jgi:4'-phosphopantetheinyl transferase
VSEPDGSAGREERLGVDLFLARFTEANRSGWVDAAEQWLSRAERSHAQQMADPDTRAQHLIGRAVLRLAAATATGGDARDIAIALTSEGKPFLADLPALQVSVAHTGRLVAVAVSRGVAVGVDLESEAETKLRPQDLAARLFAATESESLAAVPPESAARELMRYWTIKEAVGKALGSGIMPALKGTVVEASPEGMRLVSVAAGPPARDWTIHQFAVPDGVELVAIALPSAGVQLGAVHELGAEALRDGRLD